MEDCLGRAAFHRVFDYMRSLAAIANPNAGALTVLDYFSQHRRDPAAVSATITCAINYGRLLLQLRQCRFEVTPASMRVALAGEEAPLLSEDDSGGIITNLDEGGPTSPIHTYGAVRSLERQARHMRLFTDDVWVPATLDFFQQASERA
jgi:hypothetical protein